MILVFNRNPLKLLYNVYIDEPHCYLPRYWKLSLLVHPDKCSHPQAHQAFIKLNKAFKELQDPDKASLYINMVLVRDLVHAFLVLLHGRDQS